jgi:hypothetical protein
MRKMTMPRLGFTDVLPPFLQTAVAVYPVAAAKNKVTSVAPSTRRDRLADRSNAPPSTLRPTPTTKRLVRFVERALETPDDSIGFNVGAALGHSSPQFS